MIDYVKQILIGQFEASLAMLNQCIEACPHEHWEDKIANGTFRWVAYHTLFFVDFYLSPNEEAFELRDLHHRGGDEREPVACPGLSKDDTLAYVTICRQKMLDSIAAEIRRIARRPVRLLLVQITRGELHLINIRHIQHHTGQLSAVPATRAIRALPGSHSTPVDRNGWR